MIGNDEVEKALDFLRDNAKDIAEARANRIYLEQFRKSKKAMLQSQSKASSVAAAEIEAYANKEYLELLDALKIAVFEDERLRFLSAAAEAKIEVWRTQQANLRAEGKAYG